jgi:hypothetical protein
LRFQGEQKNSLYFFGFPHQRIKEKSKDIFKRAWQILQVAPLCQHNHLMAAFGMLFPLLEQEDPMLRVAMYLCPIFTMISMHAAHPRAHRLPMDASFKKEDVLVLER